MAVVEGALPTHTTLECHDVAKSLAFYRDVMGLEVNHISALVGHVWATNRHYAAVLQSAVCAQQPLLNYYTRPVPRSQDVDAIHAKIEAVRALHGIREITTPAREDEAKFGVGTYGFYVNDRDGNWWRVEDNDGPFGAVEIPPARAGDAPAPIVPAGPISYVMLESARLARSVRFYRDFLGLTVECPMPHFARVQSEASWVKFIAVDVGDALVPQKVTNHHGLSIEGTQQTVDDLRRAARERAAEFELSKVLPATRQHGSYSFYLQDADTNCWELEIWDDGISPVERGLKYGSLKGHA
jgi:catechol 2,3-dioxygenase-like lactoylglutathione lyase family enzyme